MDASPDLAWPCASSEKASKTEGPSWDDGSIAWAAGRGREGRVRGRAWRNPLGGQLARTSLGRMVRSKNEDVFVASYLHDEQAIFSGGPTTGPPSLLTSKSSTSEHTGHVIGTASIGRRAVRRDDEATARLRPLRATRYGRRETHAAALRSTRPPLPSTFAILRLRPRHAWLASRSSICQAGFAILPVLAARAVSERESRLSRRAGLVPTNKDAGGPGARTGGPTAGRDAGLDRASTPGATLLAAKLRPQPAERARLGGAPFTGYGARRGERGASALPTIVCSLAWRY